MKQQRHQLQKAKQNEVSAVTATNMDTIKANAENSRDTNGKKRKDKVDNSTPTDHPIQNVTHAGNPTKQKIAEMAPMQLMTRVPNDTLLHPQKLTKPLTSLQPKKQKTQSAATTNRGQCRREGILNRRSPDSIQSRFKPNLKWTSNTRLAKETGNSSNQKYNSRHPDQKDYPSWITEAGDKYMTTKRPLPLTSEQEDDPQTKKPKLTPPSTPNANIQHQYNEPVTAESFEQNTTFHQQHPNNIDLPASLDSIKEFIIHKNNDSYIPLMSTIPLKKRRRVLYLPLEFAEITIDGLVDSFA